MIKVIPSILTNDPNEAKELLSRCESVVDRVSIDIIDGKFVDNKTVDPVIFKEFETTANLDFQLMVVEPINWVQKCIDGGADRVIGHIEHMNDQFEFVNKVQKLGYYAGLGVDIKTPITEIDKQVLLNLDVILLMSYPAGFGGQKLDAGIYGKIMELVVIRERDNLEFKIHVDGGITFDNINKVAKAGADEVSVGRRLFNGDLRENIEKYKSLI